MPRGHRSATRPLGSRHSDPSSVVCYGMQLMVAALGFGGGGGLWEAADGANYGKGASALWTIRTVCLSNVVDAPRCG